MIQNGATQDVTEVDGTSAKVHPISGPLDSFGIAKPKPREALLIPAKTSLFILKRGNPIREPLLRLARSRWFDNFILLVILANSVFLAMVDYGHVDSNYNPVEAGSPRNRAIAKADPIFTWIFVFEAAVKIIGFGFSVYISNPWNRLDFVVVVSALLEYIKGMPKVSMLRTFRVLRPLRSVAKFPGLRRVIAAMLQSMRGLADVVLLLTFLMTVFSIMGVSFFSGLFHARCRVTPYPVKLGSCLDREAGCWADYVANVSANPLEHACLLESSGTGGFVPVANDDSTWDRRSASPWSIPQDCIWPLDDDDTRVCSQLAGGFYHCPTWDNRTCGSDFDWLGNARFQPSAVPYGFDRRTAATYTDDLQWGYGQFDHFGEAIMTVFQIITEEGWTAIMYKGMDAYNAAASAIIFCLLILLGSCIMLNLVLAVITESIAEADELNARERSHSRKVKAAERERRLLLGEGDDLLGLPPGRLRRQPPFWRPAARRLMKAPLWQAILMAAIIANTVVLAMDRYPISDKQTTNLERANVAFTAIFAMEMVISLGALGWRRYSKSPFNLFDGLIVVTSLLDLIIQVASGGQSKKTGTSALRTFRLLRVFKLARRWQSLQSVLAAMARTVLQIGNFAMLLTLFVYIYALIGMQFFSNRLHFDTDTGVPIGITDAGYAEAEVPRANFDDLLWAMTTVFQVLTRDNWNELLYNCWRSTGFVAPVYFLSLMILGSFVVMNTFLAILLSNFESDESLSRSGNGSTTSSGTGLTERARMRLFSGACELLERIREAKPAALALVDASRLRSKVRRAMGRGGAESGANSASKSGAGSPESPTVAAGMAPASPAGSTGTAAATPVGAGPGNGGRGGFGGSGGDRGDESPAWPTERQRRRIEAAAAAAKTAAAAAERAAAKVGAAAGIEEPIRVAVAAERLSATAADPKPRGVPSGTAAGDRANLLLPERISVAGTGAATIAATAAAPAGPGALPAQRSDGGGSNPTDHLPNAWLERGPPLRISASSNGGGCQSFPPPGRPSAGGGGPLGGDREGAVARGSALSQATASRVKGGSARRSSPGDPFAVRANANAIESPSEGLRRIEAGGGGGSSGSSGGQQLGSPPRPRMLGRGWTSPNLGRSGDDDLSGGAALSGGNGAAATAAARESDEADGPSMGWRGFASERVPSGGSKTAGTPSKERRPQLGRMSTFHHAAAATVTVGIQDVVEMRKRLSQARKSVAKKIGRDLDVAQEESRSFWLLGERHPIRRFCRQVITHKRFDTVILYMIAASTILLAVDTPLRDPNGAATKWIHVIDTCFNVLFFAEASLKITSLGFLLHRGAYLRSSWNQLDFFLVSIGMLSLASMVPGQGLRALRTFRVLRPLRMVARNPELKVVVDALLSAIPAIFNVSIVCALFFLVFAIIAVTFLKGTLYGCEDIVTLTTAQQHYITYPESYATAVSTLGANVTTWLAGTDCAAPLAALSAVVPTSRELCVCMLGSDAWQPVIEQSFDNAFTAMGALYEMTTTEGWFGIMTAAADQRGIDMQPVEDSSLIWIPFFVGFMVFGAFFIMNLFVGVVIDNFNTIKANKGAVFMTKEQEEWQKMQRIVMKIRPKRVHKPPRARWRRVCYDVMMLRHFDSFIVACIVGNAAVMALQHFGATYTFKEVLSHINTAFATVFLCEAIIKIIAIGKHYFSDNWNRFDFVIVVGTLAGQIVNLVVGSSVGTVAAIVRIFRLGRVLRLINRAKSLRQLFNTLVTSLPSFANIGGLLFLLFFMYAVLGIQLFATVAPYGDHDDHANFLNIWMALLTLFRCSTGENWNGFMYDLATSADGCSHSPTYPSGGRKWCEVEDGPDCVPIDGCGSRAAYPFFYSFTLVVTFVMLNLFIGVILDSFSSCDEGDNVLTPQHFDIFVEDWAKFDPDGTCYMHVEDLPDFIQILDAPMGFGEEYEATAEEVQRRILDLHIRVRDEAGNRVHFTDVAAALAKRVAVEKFGGLIDGAGGDEEADDAGTGSGGEGGSGGGQLKRADTRFRAGLQQGLRRDLNRQNDFDAGDFAPAVWGSGNGAGDAGDGGEGGDGGSLQVEDGDGRRGDGGDGGSRSGSGGSAAALAGGGGCSGDGETAEAAAERGGATSPSSGPGITPFADANPAAAATAAPGGGHDCGGPANAAPPQRGAPQEFVTPQRRRRYRVVPLGEDADAEGSVDGGDGGGNGGPADQEPAVECETPGSTRPLLQDGVSPFGSPTAPQGADSSLPWGRGAG